MKKRIISAVVAVCVCCFGFASSSVISAEANLLWNNTDFVTLDLSFREADAHISVNIAGDIGVSRITANVKLCRKDTSGEWRETAYVQSFETDGRFLTVDETVSEMKAGEYALFIKGMVFKNGKAEYISEQAYAVCTDGIHEEYEEIEYHRALGMTICENGIWEYYDRSTYEGRYQLVVDDVYRTKLNIEILRENGYEDPGHDALYALCVSFLEDKQPKCLHPLPKYQMEDKQPLTHIEADIYCLADIDEARVAADVELISFLAFWKVPRVGIIANVVENLRSQYPLICEAIFCTPSGGEGQRVDTHYYPTPYYYTSYTNPTDGKRYHRPHKNCYSCEHVANYTPVICLYNDNRCTGGCVELFKH